MALAGPGGRAVFAPASKTTKQQGEKADRQAGPTSLQPGRTDGGRNRPLPPAHSLARFFWPAAGFAPSPRPVLSAAAAAAAARSVPPSLLARPERRHRRKCEPPRRSRPRRPRGVGWAEAWPCERLLICKERPHATPAIRAALRGPSERLAATRQTDRQAEADRQTRLT